MASEREPHTLREVIGIFVDGAQIKAAIDDLTACGFEKDRLGLLASEYAVKSSLGELYTRTNVSHDPSKAPSMAFVEADSDGEMVQSGRGGLYFAGSTMALGAVVVSAAVLGGALLSALAGVAAVGALGSLAGSIISQSDAEYLEQEVEKGRLLLFVRVDDAGAEAQAEEILSRHAALDIRAYDVNVSPKPARE